MLNLEIIVGLQRLLQMNGKTVSAIYLFSFGSKGPLKYLPVYDPGAGSL